MIDSFRQRGTEYKKKRNQASTTVQEPDSNEPGVSNGWTDDIPGIIFLPAGRYDGSVTGNAFDRQGGTSYMREAEGNRKNCRSGAHNATM